MIYSCFFILFGIYVGQEYSLPNIKILSLGLMQYLHDKYNEHQKLNDGKELEKKIGSNNDLNIINIIKIISDKFTNKLTN
jgi:hypothetical protein